MPQAQPEYNQIVCQLFVSREAYGYVRIGGVYTPPEHRGHGYAAALTAKATADSHGKGHQVMLNTKAADGLANRLYRRIGFTSRGELLEIALSTS